MRTIAEVDEVDSAGFVMVWV